MECTLMTATSKRVWDDLSKISADTPMGRVTVFTDHMTSVFPLSKGELKLTGSEGEISIPIHSGWMAVSRNVCQILLASF